MAYPDFNLEFRLKTDASAEAVGAVLCQLHSDVEKPIAYVIWKLKIPEQNYSTIERELLGIVLGIEHFWLYFLGRKFTVITDHKPLTFLHSIREPKGRQARWLQTLMQYEFTIEHRPGNEHRDADALSRHPAPKEPVQCAACGWNTDGVVRMRQYQRSDPVLSQVIDRLESNAACPAPIGI